MVLPPDRVARAAETATAGSSGAGASGGRAGRPAAASGASTWRSERGVACSAWPRSRDVGTPPGAGGAASDLIPGEQHGVVGKASPGGAPLRDHERPDNAPHLPPALGRDAPRQANLGVESSERVLDVPYPCLHLGHLEDAAWRVERQQIDPAAFAEDAIARLGPHIPAMASVRLRPDSNEQRMISIEEAVEIARTTPPRRELGVRIERPKQSTDLLQAPAR